MDPQADQEQLLINEVQLLLAEKRTYFSVLRTGVAVFALPLSIIVFLVAIAASRPIPFHPAAVATIGGLLLLISVAGLWLISSSEFKLRRINHLIDSIKKEHKRLAEIIL